MLKSTKTEKLQDLTAVNFNNIEDERYENLLKAIHQGLYSKTFPLPEEQESVEDWIARSKKENRVPRQFISAHFTDLDQALRLSDEIAALKEIQEKTTEQESQLQNLQTQFDALTVAFVVGEQYQGTGAASVNYAIRNKDYDGKTQGKPRYAAKDFIDHQVSQYQDFAKENNETIVLVTWEANNPRLTPFFDRYGNPDFTVDVMDPARRVEILLGYGAERIGFEWLQPPLSSEQEGCASLLLYSYPVLGLSPTLEQKVAALNNFVDAFYKTFPVEGKFQENPPRPPLQYAEFCEKQALELSGITLPTGITRLPELMEKFSFMEYKSNEKKKSAIKGLKQFIFERDPNDSQDLRSKIESVVRDNFGFGDGDDIKIAYYVQFIAKDLATELQESATDVRKMVQGLEKMKENPNIFAIKETVPEKQEPKSVMKLWQEMVKQQRTVPDGDRGRSPGG